MFRGDTRNGTPIADWPRICDECAKYDRFLIDIIKYDESREISVQQMRYFHGVVVPLFSEWNGDSKECWETRLKLECGPKWFAPKALNIDGKAYILVPSKKKLTVKDCNEWLENIVDYGLRCGVVVPPPDPEWRENNAVI